MLASNADLADSAVASMDDLTLAAKPAPSKKPADEHGPYIAALLKRSRAIRKRVERIEKYEGKPWDSLNPDQRESLSQLDGLRHALRELDEIVKMLEPIEHDDRKQLKKLQKQQQQDRAHAVKEALRDNEQQTHAMLKTYVTLMRELADLDAMEPVIQALRGIFFNDADPQALIDHVRRVMQRDDSVLVEGVTYADVHRRLVESPLRVEDLLAAVSAESVETASTITPATGVTFMVNDDTETAAPLQNEEEEEQHPEEPQPVADTVVLPAPLPQLSFMCGEEFLRVAAPQASQQQPPADPPAASADEEHSKAATSSTLPADQKAPRRPNHRRYQGARGRSGGPDINGTGGGYRRPRSNEKQPKQFREKPVRA